VNDRGLLDHVLWQQAIIQQLRFRLSSHRQWCHGCGSPLALDAECMTCLRARHGPFFAIQAEPAPSSRLWLGAKDRG